MKAKLLLTIVLYMSAFQVHSATLDIITRRFCDRMPGGADNNYVFKCIKNDELIDIMERENSARLYFATSDIMNNLLTDDRYIYVNVVMDEPTVGATGKICYRVIRELDYDRDGYYAVEECEYQGEGRFVLY